MPLPSLFEVEIKNSQQDLNHATSAIKNALTLACQQLHPTIFAAASLISPVVCENGKLCEWYVSGKRVCEQYTNRSLAHQIPLYKHITMVEYAEGEFCEAMSTAISCFCLTSGGVRQHAWTARQRKITMMSAAAISATMKNGAWASETSRMMRMLPLSLRTNMSQQQLETAAKNPARHMFAIAGVKPPAWAEKMEGSCAFVRFSVHGLRLLAESPDDLYPEPENPYQFARAIKRKLAAQLMARNEE